MSTFGFCSAENFKRLEDFPAYTSVIRCFGKPIIPPLITPQEKVEIAKLRLSLVQQKKQFVTIAKEDFGKCKDSCRTNNEQLFYQKNIDCVQCQECPTCKISALNSSSLTKFNGNHLGNEMLVSMSKLPTSGICSTVHTNVIVCPNVAKQRYCENCDTEPGDSNSEFCDYYYESDCNYQSCQRNDGDSDVPYRSIFEKQTQNEDVSEDEQGSVADGTEFGSLPTVIYNKKALVEDTDCESIVTCMTQSTDLDKYMDCSIEFSSPDDFVINSQSQLSNEMSISSRSQDISSETIVNTENELTPCASAMAELNDFIEESNQPSENSHNAFSRDLTNINTHNRAYSVDSYMKVLRASARNLYLKKSQSEPSQPDRKGLENFGINTKTNRIKNLTDDAEFMSSSSEKVELSSSIYLPCTESNDLNSSAEIKTDEKVMQQHVRRNSYTLSEPSLALIMAHADCSCQGESSIETSPHSYSSGHENVIPNIAFKKETLNYILPPTLYREKKFPILSLEQPIYIKEPQHNSINSDVVSDSETVDSLVNATDGENDDHHDESSIYSSISDKIAKSDIDKYTISEEVLSSTEGDTTLVDSLKTEINHENESCEEVCNSSPLKCEDLKQSDKGEFLNCLFEDLRKNHQSRVNQLVEEQNKQWVKLQEEFKEQERKLFEKLTSFGISAIPGDFNINYPNAASNINNENTMDNQIALHTFDSSQCQLTSSDSNSTNLSSETEMPTIIQNNLDKTSKHAEDKEQKVEYVNSNQKENIHSEKPEPLTKPHLNKNINADLFHNREHFHKESIVENNLMLFSSNNEYILHNELREQEPNFHIPLQNVSNDSNLTSSNILLKDENDHSNILMQDSIKTNLHTQGIIQTGKHLSVTLQHKVNTIDNTSKNLVIDQPDLKTCNLDKENDGTKNIFVNQVSTSSRIISEENMPTQVLPSFNSHFGIDDIRNTCESGMYLKNDIEQFVAESPSCNLNIGKTNLNRCSQIVTNQEIILGNHYLPQKSAEMYIQAKAIKLAPASSLANWKRKKNKDLNDPDLLKRFEKLPAFVKGYLTRRLLKTERVQGLLKSLQETAILMENLSKELTIKGSSISERDKEFHNQLFAQLLGNFEELYDIICNKSTKEKMKIIAESRNFRLRKKKAEKSQESPNVLMVADKSASISLEKPKLSSATVKSLQRKKRSLVDSRTFTVEDLKQSRSRSIVDSRTYKVEDLKPSKPRAHSASNKKSHSTSPSRIYQTSVGVNLNRKIKSLIKPSQTQHWK